MLLVFLAAVSAQPAVDAPRSVAAETPARAFVRILRAAAIHGDHLEATEESVKRVTSVRERDGTVRSATLVEYY